ncbi:hypothetical protein [Tatumella sp. JGM118]|uniref:hypothetical protein n=1 Tax=Tatumella sp. JGM118 TaxID=2799796 RepID=UPI001BAE7CBA|nr:hypothetical protein [Tatumella sp. JGM118]MBS0909576.1 hypothetical protein [Tatumella sp. JGM118]
MIKSPLAAGMTTGNHAAAFSGPGRISGGRTLWWMEKTYRAVSFPAADRRHWRSLSPL